jgi:hypothetical protein
MMDAANLTTSQRQQHRQDAVKYASIMANISIRDGKSAYERFFGKQPLLLYKHMGVNFRRIGYMTTGNT